MRCIGQAPQRCRRADLSHRRPAAICLKGL
jgi:hypothetical protein